MNVSKKTLTVTSMIETGQTNRKEKKKKDDND